MTIDRRELRRVLVERYPFVRDPDVGPSSVAAGECDRCNEAPRALVTCGPVAWEALCRGCADAVGDDGWCDGHRDDAVAWRRTMSGWPPEHETVARLWWVATGEVSLDPRLVERAVAALPTLGPGPGPGPGPGRPGSDG